MSFPLQDKRADEKLGQILGRVGSVRMRLNSLALQHALFYTLAIAIACGAAIFAGAYLVSPFAFLIGGSVLIVIAAGGIASAIAAGWRMRTSAVRAAAIADDRAELKGRLSTIVALAHSETRGPLWSYLVEDTLGHDDEFATSKIERRRVSRAIYPLAGALVLAALAFPISKIKHAPQVAAGNGQDDLTVDLDDLHLRAADPGDESGMQVTADPATMRRLEDKLARENAGGRRRRREFAESTGESRARHGGKFTKQTDRAAGGLEAAPQPAAGRCGRRSGSKRNSSRARCAEESARRRRRTVQTGSAKVQARARAAAGRRFAPAEFASLRPAAPAPQASNPTPARTTPIKTTARANAVSSKAARTAATAARRTESGPILTACSARPRRRSSATRASRLRSKRGRSITAQRAPVTPTSRPKCALRSA